MSIPAHIDAMPVLWSLVTEGFAATVQSNGMGYHWQGLYNPGLAETLGKFRRAQANDFPPTLKMILLVGTYMSERYHGRMYAKAQNLRPALRAGFDRVLEQVDVLALPTTSMKAYRYEPDIDMKELVTHALNMANNTAPSDVTGHPAISIPCGKSNGLPVGLMLVGRHFSTMQPCSGRPTPLSST